LKLIARDHTSLTIAHRLSTIIDADAILVLEHGRIVERGTHVALLAANGVYARMWRLQQDERRDGAAAPTTGGDSRLPEPSELRDTNPASTAAAAATLRSAS
jgi:ATP-binding cassette subfamily B protein